MLLVLSHLMRTPSLSTSLPICVSMSLFVKQEFHSYFSPQRKCVLLESLSLASSSSLVLSHPIPLSLEVQHLYL